MVPDLVSVGLVVDKWFETGGVSPGIFNPSFRAVSSTTKYGWMGPAGPNNEQSANRARYYFVEQKERALRFNSIRSFIVDWLVN